MGFFPKMTASAEDVSTSELRAQSRDNGDMKFAQTTSISADRASSESEDACIDKEAQTGVQRVQALASIWSRSNLIAAYLLYALSIWTVFLLLTWLAVYG